LSQPKEIKIEYPEMRVPLTNTNLSTSSWQAKFTHKKKEKKSPLEPNKKKLKIGYPEMRGSTALSTSSS